MEPIRFIGWDTEGGNFGDGHRTTYIANSTGDDQLWPRGLDRSRAHETLIPWIFHAANAHKKTVHVWYYFNYDVTMILLGLPKDKLIAIVQNESDFCEIEIGGDLYKIRYQPKRRLYIKKRTMDEARIRRHHETKLANGNKPSDNFGWETVVMYDISSMYQMSFLNAVEKNLKLTPQEHAQIDAGKKRRNEFAELDAETISYCQLEVQLLQRLAEDLAENITAKGLKISNWSSPGAIAQAVLKNQKFYDCLNRSINFHRRDGNATPLGHAVRCAMKGARIETVRYGTAPNGCHDYDINSAYPSVMRELPDMGAESGKWQWYPKGAKIAELSNFALVKVAWKASKSMPFYPFAYRDSKGGISYPRLYNGWLHIHELRTALIHDRTAEYQIFEAYDFARSNETHPFAYYIDGEYRSRQKHKVEGNGIEKVEKLALNSMYGKMAQQVGARADGERIVQPISQDLYMAGYITSRCRMIIYDMGMRAPKNVISFATDGITFDKKIAAIETTKNLGGWEYKHWTGPCHFLMAGCYTLTMAGADESKMGTRGMRPPTDVREWMAKVTAAWTLGGESLTVNNRIFYNTKLALVRREWEDKVGQWEDVDRQIKITCLGDKRLYDKSQSHKNAAQELISTLPSSIRALAGNESAPCPYRYELLGEEAVELEINKALDPWS